MTPHRANVPVVLRGVGIMPGQHVFADDSGAVVLPADDVEHVIEGAQQVRREDAGFREQIATERLGAPPGKRGQTER